MEFFIVIGAVACAAVVAVVAALAWPLHIKPLRRRRYEREHHRSKFREGRRDSLEEI